MEFKIFYLFAACLLIILDIAILSRLKLTSRRKITFSFSTAFFAVALIITSYAMLLIAFINNNFSIDGVYSFSSSGASLLSKIYSSWAGAGGSMLFLTVLLGIFYFGLRLFSLIKTDRLNVVTCQVFGFVLIVFIIVCLLRNPFESLSVTPAEGLGLNPQLQSVWMAIHPPIVFSAYAFVVLAYALTIASIKTDREIDNSNLFKVSTYAALILLTLGISLGGLWAYEVLGWGGYWAWDPVETASLLPWLFLVAYFIVRTISRAKTSLIRESMIMITFGSLVFLSALTRGGLTQSVHSYAVSAIGPIMLTFAGGMIAYFFYLTRRKRKPLFKMEVDKKSLSSRSSFVGFWALILIALVCLVGLVFPNFAYSYFTYPFVVLFIVATVGYSLSDKNHYTRQILIVVAALIVGMFFSIIGIADVNILVTLTLPLLVVALCGSIYKISKVRRKSQLGPRLFAFAMIVLLIGVFLSAGAKTAVTITDIKPNTLNEAMQIKIEITNLQIENSTSNVYSEQANAIIPEFSIMKADISIERFDRTCQGSLSASLYPNYGLVIKPLIIPTETGDIYIHFEYSDSLYNALVQAFNGNGVTPDEVSIAIQNSPLIYLVWSGVILITLAIAFQFASEIASQKEKSL
jgi:cytochrome c biogenesis factor